MGWMDIPLSEFGIEAAHKTGQKIKKLGIDFGIAYTSVLSRASETLNIIEEELGTKIKTRTSYKLNAKHYGTLEGMSKEDAITRYGEEALAKWIRGYEDKAPEISVADERFPGNDPKYKDILKFELPLSESQKDVYDRVIDYFEHEISTFLKVGENVLVVAHGSTLRVLTKYLENIPDDEMNAIEIPNDSIIIYDMDEDLKIQDKQAIN